MSIESIAAAATSGSTTTQDRALIADNLDTFLKLLTTQLQNQNPLDPIDTNQFTQQLVEFSSVEQAVKGNELLTQIVTSNTANATTTAIDYIGKQVQAKGAETTLKAGEANWTYTIGQNSPDASVTIRDSSGEIVFSEVTTLEAGTNTYSWDGVKSSGSTANDGAYSITIEASDIDGNNIGVSTSVSGIVTGVEFDGADTILNIGSSRVKLTSVETVTAI